MLRYKAALLIGAVGILFAPLGLWTAHQLADSTVQQAGKDLAAAVIAGILIFPLGSALAMPDWYINAARALAPWNYAFTFPNPPQGDRGQLLSADAVKLALGTMLSLGAAAFALFGRDLIGARAKRSAGSAPHDQHGAHGAQGDQDQRPEPVDVEPGQVFPGEEVEPQPDQDQPDEPRPAP